MIRAAGRIIVMVVAVAALAVVASGFGFGARDAGAQMGLMVSIAAFASEPNPVQVPAGTTVTWLDLDIAPHTVTSR